MAKSNEPPLGSRREERWFVLRLAIAGLAVVAVIAGLLKVRQQQGTGTFPRVELADGTWLVVRSVTTGTNHKLELPYPLATQLARWKQSHQEVHVSNTNRMVVWLVRENAKREMLDLDWFGRCEIALSEDFTIPASQYHQQHNSRNGSSGSGTGHSGYSDAKTVGKTKKKHDVAVVRCDFPIVRPREGKMRLNVYDGTKQIVAVLDIPYPKLPAAPIEDWQAESLPVKKVAGNLEVTLESIPYRINSWDHALSVSPTLKFLHGGEPSTTWSSNCELIDALGNVSHAYHCDLSPLEPVWKMRLTLTQNVNGRFLPAETRTLSPLPLAPARQLTLHSGTYEVNGTEIRIVGIVGTGPVEFTLPNSNSQFKTKDYMPGNRTSGMSSSCTGNRCDVDFSTGHPCLITADPAVGVENSIQLIAQDQDGTSLSSDFSSSTQGLRFWFFEPKPTTTSVKFTFIVQQPRHVEYFIAPPRMKDILKAEQ